jgi:peptidoglycan/LPS O-acetylase OafA/YrhL
MSRARMWLTGSPIDDGALDGRNNFHLIRLVAALLVLFSHAYHLLQRGADEPIGRWFVWLDASLLGVALFFFVSGFLVSRSWDRRRSLGGFLAARALRIVPALWLALFVTVFGLGVAMTGLPKSHYLTSPYTYEYLVLNAMLNTQYLLPGVFPANPAPGVNGSLWTIPLEVVLYLILAVCGWLGLLAPSGSMRDTLRRVAENPLLGGALILVAVLLIAKVINTGAQYYGLAGYFLLGAVCYRFRHRLMLRIDLALVLLIVAVAAAHTAAGPIVAPLAIAGTTLVVAMHPAFRMRETWLHRHDYSYGTYLYGFPVQQTLIVAGLSSPWPLFGSAVVVTVALAALSWHLVERPALLQKSRVEGWLRSVVSPSRRRSL